MLSVGSCGMWTYAATKAKVPSKTITDSTDQGALKVARSRFLEVSSVYCLFSVITASAT